jgi:hypothetical protein
MKTILITASLFITSILSAQQIGDGFPSILTSDFSAPLKSGVYNGNGASGIAPDYSHSWQHLFVTRHMNQSNNYQLQITSSFTVNDRLFFRKIATADLSATNTTWYELATRGTNSFVGNQNINGKLDVKDITVWNSNSGNPEEHGQINFENANHGIRRIGNVVDIFTSGGAESAITFTPRSFNPSTGLYSIMNVAMKISNDGNVGIGTTNPTSKLTVAGNINSREVKVTVDAGADFVFENNYNLPSLDAVEKFIKENKHLPEIASADEMKKDGIYLSEMNIKLLQKIEELTLYMIEMKKENERQNEEIKNFKSNK